MRKTVPEGFMGLLWKRGKITQQLPPGRYFYSVTLSQRIDLFDMRVQQLSVPLIEYATKDNLTVRCALTISWSITDPATMVRTSAYPASVIQIQAQDTLRSICSTYTLDELLLHLTEIHAAIGQQLANSLPAYGLALTALSPLNVVIPRSLRQAYEAEAVARKRAAADLEEARGRTAVLRHLANAASQVEQQPALLQLLMGQKAKSVQFQFSETPVLKKSKQS